MQQNEAFCRSSIPLPSKRFRGSARRERFLPSEAHLPNAFLPKAGPAAAPPRGQCPRRYAKVVFVERLTHTKEE
jgi:hypothetical protein